MMGRLAELIGDHTFVEVNEAMALAERVVQACVAYVTLEYGRAVGESLRREFLPRCWPAYPTSIGTPVDCVYVASKKNI